MLGAKEKIMINNDNGPKSASPSDESNEIAHADGQIDHSKRRLTKAGLAVSGVMLTLASKSVLAGKNTGYATGGTTFLCTSPSGFSSLNVSAPGKNQSSCLGRTPGFWKEWPTEWGHCTPAFDPGVCTETNPSGACKTFNPNTGTPFHSGVMGRSYPGGFSGLSGSRFGSLSLMGVMVNNDSSLDPANVGAHVAATVLNIARGWIPSTVMSMSTILSIWQSYDSMGYFEPAAGVQWNGADIVVYLKTTMS
jgi:hypothetical protein